MREHASGTRVTARSMRRNAAVPLFCRTSGEAKDISELSRKGVSDIQTTSQL